MTQFLADPDALIEAFIVRYPPTVFHSAWQWTSDLVQERRLATVIDAEPTLTDDELRDWLTQLPGDFFRNQTAEQAVATQRIADIIEANERYTDAAKAEFLNSSDLSLLAHARGHGFSVVTFDVSIPDSESVITLVDVAAEIGVETLSWQAMLVEEGARF